MGRCTEELGGEGREGMVTPTCIYRRMGTGQGADDELRSSSTVSFRSLPGRLCQELNLQYWPGLAAMCQWFSNYGHRGP